MNKLLLAVIIIILLILTQSKKEDTAEEFCADCNMRHDRHVRNHYGYWTRYMYPARYWNYGSYGYYYNPLPCMTTLFGDTRCYY